MDRRAVPENWAAPSAQLSHADHRLALTHKHKRVDRESRFGITAQIAISFFLLVHTKAEERQGGSQTQVSYLLLGSSLVSVHFLSDSDPRGPAK